MPATAKQRGCQLLAWLTSSNPVSACRHTVSSEDQPSSHSHHPVIKIIVISACVGRTSPSSFLSESKGYFSQNISECVLTLKSNLSSLYIAANCHFDWNSNILRKWEKMCWLTGQNVCVHIPPSISFNYPSFFNCMPHKLTECSV